MNERKEAMPEGIGYLERRDLGNLTVRGKPETTLEFPFKVLTLGSHEFPEMIKVLGAGRVGDDTFLGDTFEYLSEEVLTSKEPPCSVEVRETIEVDDKLMGTLRQVGTEALLVGDCFVVPEEPDKLWFRSLAIFKRVPRPGEINVREGI
jgi:hypothetical protein